MKAIDYVDKALKEIDGADLASGYVKTSPMFVDVVAAPFKKLMPWFVQNGFALIPPKFGVSPPGTFAVLQQADNVFVSIEPAFGGKINTGFPEGWPQKITALVTAGFVDLGSPSVKRRMQKKRKNPGSRYRTEGTFSAWMTTVNGILLKDISLGSWQLTKQPYQEWFMEGMKPGTAANIVIDGVSTGQIKRRYKRKK